MSKKGLGFQYRECTYKYRAKYNHETNKWEGKLETSKYIQVEESACVFHYGQSCFEGLKALRHKDGSIHVFRPDQNAKRLQDSCRKLLMPEVPVDFFLDAVKEIVEANAEFVPEYGTGESLYIRPWVMGVGDNLGVKTAPEFMFNIFVNPVGSYFSGDLSAVRFVTSEYDRAAPAGTGHVKAGGNYAASFSSKMEAVKAGFADCVYLDPATHTKIDEIGAANFIAVTKNNEIITPKSPSVLPSITRKSLMYLAEKELGLTPVEGECFIDKLDNFTEAAACGTAAVVTPISSITHKDNEHVFGDGNVGPVTKKLHALLTGIQSGDVEGPEGWLFRVK